MNERQDLNRTQVINNLVAFREMWQGVDADLIEVTASVGLLLADMLVVLGLDEGERATVLGAGLAEQIEGVTNAIA